MPASIVGLYDEGKQSFDSSVGGIPGGIASKAFLKECPPAPTSASTASAGSCVSTIPSYGDMLGHLVKAKVLGQADLAYFTAITDGDTAKQTEAQFYILALFSLTVKGKLSPDQAKALALELAKTPKIDVKGVKRGYAVIIAALPLLAGAKTPLTPPQKQAVALLLAQAKLGEEQITSTFVGMVLEQYLAAPGTSFDPVQFTAGIQGANHYVTDEAFLSAVGDHSLPFNLAVKYLATKLDNPSDVVDPSLKQLLTKLQALKELIIKKMAADEGGAKDKYGSMLRMLGLDNLRVVRSDKVATLFVALDKGKDINKDERDSTRTFFRDKKGAWTEIKSASPLAQPLFAHMAGDDKQVSQREYNITVQEIVDAATAQGTTLDAAFASFNGEGVTAYVQVDAGQLQQAQDFLAADFNNLPSNPSQLKATLRASGYTEQVVEIVVSARAAQPRASAEKLAAAVVQFYLSQVFAGETTNLADTIINWAQPNIEANCEDEHFAILRASDSPEDQVRLASGLINRLADQGRVDEALVYYHYFTAPGSDDRIAGLANSVQALDLIFNGYLKQGRIQAAYDLLAEFLGEADLADRAKQLIDKAIATADAASLLICRQALAFIPDNYVVQGNSENEWRGEATVAAYKTRINRVLEIPVSVKALIISVFDYGDNSNPRSDDDRTAPETKIWLVKKNLTTPADTRLQATIRALEKQAENDLQASFWLAECYRLQAYLTKKITRNSGSQAWHGPALVLDIKAAQQYQQAFYQANQATTSANPYLQIQCTNAQAEIIIGWSKYMTKERSAIGESGYNRNGHTPAAKAARSAMRPLAQALPADFTVQVAGQRGLETIDRLNFIERYFGLKSDKEVPAEVKPGQTVAAIVVKRRGGGLVAAGTKGAAAPAAPDRTAAQIAAAAANTPGQ